MRKYDTWMQLLLEFADFVSISFRNTTFSIVVVML